MYSNPETNTENDLEITELEKLGITICRAVAKNKIISIIANQIIDILGNHFCLPLRKTPVTTPNIKSTTIVINDTIRKRNLTSYL